MRKKFKIMHKSFDRPEVLSNKVPTSLLTIDNFKKRTFISNDVGSLFI